MNSQARIRINFSTRELECEGTRADVDSLLERFKSVVERFGAGGADSTDTSPPARDATTAVATVGAPTAVEFGEMLAQLRGDIADGDRVLAAAYFLHQTNGTEGFSTGEVTQLLRRHGVNVANPSVYVR